MPEIIYTDAQRLRQILSNLLSNAFKFTMQGSVTFRIGIASIDELEPLEDAQDSYYIRFSVTDTGIGISENKQALIFDAFQQADGHTEREYGGTGLGLSITKQLVSLLGGKISLVSEKGQAAPLTSICRLPGMLLSMKNSIHCRKSWRKPRMNWLPQPGPDIITTTPCWPIKKF